MTSARTIARQRTTITSATALAAALAVGLTGCGGSGGNGASDDGDGDDGAGRDGSEAEQAAQGPLDRLLADAYAGRTEEALNRKQMEVEELVAACMGELGFEYVPVDPATDPATGAVFEAIPWETVEYAQQWGYGITVMPGMDPDEVAEHEAASNGWEDPNTAITDAMSETELAAYQLALWGEPEEGSDVTPGWEDMGCSGAAQHEVYGDAFGTDNPFAELEEEMSRTEDAVATDDRVLATEADWSSCMADAGHPGLAKVPDAPRAIMDEVSDVLMRGGSEDAIAAALAEVSSEEIALAVADYTCREDSGYAAAYHQVDLELQQQFCDAHEAELEDWVAYQQEQWA